MGSNNVKGATSSNVWGLKWTLQHELKTGLTLKKQFGNRYSKLNCFSGFVCSLRAILMSFYKWMTGEVTSAIVLGGFMTSGRQVLWTWCRWLLICWIITASVAESGTFADDCVFSQTFSHTLLLFQNESQTGFLIKDVSVDVRTR